MTLLVMFYKWVSLVPRKIHISFLPNEMNNYLLYLLLVNIFHRVVLFKALRFFQQYHLSSVCLSQFQLNVTDLFEQLAATIVTLKQPATLTFSGYKLRQKLRGEYKDNFQMGI